MDDIIFYIAITAAATVVIGLNLYHLRKKFEEFKETMLIVSLLQTQNVMLDHAMIQAIIRKMDWNMTDMEALMESEIDQSVYQSICDQLKTFQSGQNNGFSPME